MKNWLYLASFLMIFSACRDDKFDAPPTDFTDPGLEVTHTIAELKASHILGEYNQIEEDMILSGIIVADDESGNFYQRLIIDDGTAGIEIGIRANDLFNLYPAGRRLYVKAKDLWIGDYNGVVQLGGSVEEDGNFQRINGIEEVLISQYIVGGAIEGQPAPIEIGINDLNTSHISRLVKIDNAEFAPGSRNTTYADPAANPPQSVNHFIQDCNGGSLIMRTSGYCSFAASITPSGNGSVVAIFSVFGTDRQLFIRDTTDVNMEGPTCNQNIETKDISEIRDLFSGNEVNAPAAVIEGIVISDRQSGNINALNAVIQQEGDKGIVIRYLDEHSLNLGMKVRVDLTGGTISEYFDLLQVGGVNPANTEILSSGNSITPAIKTVAQILNEGNAIESTLVKIENPSVSGGAVWGDSDIEIQDGTGSLPVFTFSFASFGNQAIPATVNSLTGIVGDYEGRQLNMRNGDDVDDGGMSGGDPEPISIESIRDSWSGSTSTISGNNYIEGIVISDFEAGNIHPQNLVIQDGDFGIVVRFTENHSHALGTRLKVVVFNQELSEYNDLLQVNNVSIDNASDEGTGSVVAKKMSISEILANSEEIESTLIEIEGATISGNSTLSESTTITDNTGSMPMYTRPTAAFSSESIPSGAINLTGIISQFGDVQVNIRNLDDLN